MKDKRSHKAVVRRKLISLAVASCFTVSNPLFANPTGPKVVSGQASFLQSGNLLQVTNSPSAIINWQSFSIGASEITRFIQQSQASAVLNRVTGSAGVIDPSVILGALQSNGRVFLVNPSGILFGAGAQVDVAGLVASSLKLSDTDFLAARLRFTDVPGAGAIVNQGKIATGSGGNVYLAGPAVTNSGIIASPRGEVVLAAGNSVELVDPGTPNLRVAIAAPDNQALNLGQIVADSGRIGIYAGLINHSGTVRADTVEAGKNGEILLRASKNIVLEPGSVISASGAPGGVHDGGTVRIVAEDTLDMQRGSAVHVDGGVDGGNGGFLELSGKQLIALNGEFTGSARKDGYRHGSLLLDPLNINVGALGITGTISLASSAGAMVIKQDGTRIYLVRPNFSFSGSDVIEVIDTASNSIVASIDLQDFSNAAVSGMALSPDGAKLYAVYGNTGAGAGYIRVIDTSTNTVANTYGVGGPTNLFGMAVDPSDRIYIAGNNPFSNPSTASMVVIDGVTGNQLANVPVAFNPQQVFINPAGTRVYVTSVSPTLVLQEFAVGTNTLLASTQLGSRPNRNVFSADGTKLYMAYAGRIEVRDPGTMSVIDTLPLGADSLALSGNTAYIARGDSASILDLTTKTAKQSFTIGTATQGAGIVFIDANNRIFTASQSTVTIIDLNAGTDATTGGVIAHTDAPGATLSLPVSALSGAWTNVSLAATNNVSVNAPIADTDVPAGGSLSLTAGNDVNVNAWIGAPTARFNHDLTLTAGNNVNVNGSIYQGNNPLVLAADANIPAQSIAPDGIGNVNIKALGAPVVVDTLGSLTVTGKDFIILGGRSASVTVNVGGLLDANLSGNFTLQGGQVSADVGDNVNASASLQANAINIIAAGAITIAGGDNAEASGCCVGDNGVMGGTGAVTVNSDATMTAATSINLTAATGITIRGGDNAYASACCNGMSGGTGNGTATLNANAMVAAGTTLMLTAPTVTIRGGDFAEASACCNGEDGAGNGAGAAINNANATVTAGGNLTINATTLAIRGGNDAEAFACCNGTSGGVGAGAATVNTNATVTAGQDLIINATGPVTIAGGNNASASACCNGSDGNGTGSVAVSANAAVSAGRHVNLTATSLTVRGGDSASASACCNGSSGGNGAATVASSARGSLTAAQDMTLNVSGPVIVRGGDNASASACCNGSGGGAGNVTVSADSRAQVSAGGVLSLTAASLEVRGGDNASASACCNGSSGGTATINGTTLAGASLTAGGAMTLNLGSGALTVRGGDFASASACCNASSGGVANIAVATDASATVSAGSTLTINAGSVTIRGGNYGSAEACCNGDSGGNGAIAVTGNASALVSAGTNLTLTATSLTVSGGNSASASACCNASFAGAPTASMNANASLTAGQAMTLSVSGPVLVNGGNSGSASASGGRNTATVNANATISAGTTLTVSATSLTVRGGNSGSASASGAGTNTAVANANASILANDMTLTVSGPVQVAGGTEMSISASAIPAGSRNTATMNAKALVRATNDLTLNVNNGSVTVRGGSGSEMSASGGAGVARVTGNLDAELSAGRNLAITITNGDLTVRGGQSMSNSASAAFAATAADAVSTWNASGKIAAGNNVNILVSGSATVRGGDNNSASASGGNNAGNVTTAVINAGGSIEAGGMLTLSAGSLTVRGGNANSASASDVGRHTATVNATGKLASTGAMSLTTTGSLAVSGGNNSVASGSLGAAGAPNRATIDAGALITAGNGLTLTAGSMTVQGGTQALGIDAAATGAGSNFATTLANATVMTSAGDLMYTGGPVSILGGTARSRGGTGTNTAIAEAGALVQSAANKTFDVTGDLVITGGSALDDPLFPNLGGAFARAVMDPGTIDVTASGDVLITGGTYTGVGSAYAGITATGPINLTIGGATGLNVTGGNPGTGPMITGISSVTVTFSGSGTQSIDDTQPRDGGFIQAGAFVPPPPPPPSTPPNAVLELPPPAPTQIHDPIFSESGQSTGASQTTDSAQQTAQSGGGEQQPSEKEEKKTIPVCR